MKNFISTIAAGFVFVTGASSATAGTLESLKQEKRPILLFAKSRSFAQLGKQLDLLRDYRPDLQERDIVVLNTTGNQETSAAIGYVSIDRGTARTLHRRFEPDMKGLTVILIGKDGDEKARWTSVVEPQEIFDLIDSMPMRKQEVKEQIETQ